TQPVVCAATLFSFYRSGDHRYLHSFPTRRSSDLIANYQDVLNKLPLILVTSNWVKEMYIRDGISGDRIEVLPVGCDTDSFVPHRSEEHTSELQSRENLVCRLLLEKKKENHSSAHV